ncbi:MAG: hypothetical protein K2X08_07170 [Chlamydiales bacterium]|nr:hypothetical protein [Chlamydiales bacterium]
MSGNIPVYQTTSGGVLGSGYSALCASAMGSSLINLYAMLNAQNKLKALNTQNIQKEAEAQSNATIEAGKKERMGSFIQAGAQLGQTASGLYSAGKGVDREWDSQSKLGEISAGKGENLNLLAKQMNEKPIPTVDQSIIEKAIKGDPADPLTSDDKLLVKNYATDWQKGALKEVIKENPERANDLGDLLTPSNKPDLETILATKGAVKQLDEAGLENLQKNLSPEQRKAVIEQANLFEKQELPEQQRITRENQTETNKQAMWSQQIFGPFAQATGQAGHGIYKAEADQERAAGQLAGAAEQMAGGCNNTIDTVLNMLKGTIEALMSAQATMSQKTA